MLVGLCILGGLLLVALLRMLLLSRANRRMRLACAKMEKQAAAQQVEISAIHDEASSWRAKMQRQFDAMRGDFTHRLLQVEQGGRHALQHFEDIQEEALAEARAKISALESRLAAKPAAAAPPRPAPSSASSLPSLPAMETLRLQSLEAELAAARAEIAASGQQVAALQRALLLARRRQPATRKNSARGMLRGA